MAKSLLNNPSHHLKRADPETVKVTVDKAKLLIDALSAFFLEMFLIAEAGETAQIIEMEAGPEAAQEYLKRTIMRDHPGNDVKGE